MQKITHIIQETRVTTDSVELKLKAKKNLNSIKALKLRLTTKLNDQDPSNEQFYYKACWNLSEAQLWNIVERSESARDPRRYFMAAASREMK